MISLNHMKNKILFLVLVSLLALPNLSFAENNASSTKKETEKRETIRDEIEAKKESLKNSVEERRQNAEDKIKERMDQFVQNVKNRYEAAISRLGILADRIDSRIAKIEKQNTLKETSESTDLSKAKELMVVAREKIEIAKISITDIASTTITTTNTSASTTKEILKQKFNIIKTQIKKAKEDIKTAHAALVDVVNSLKPGQNKEKIEN